MILDKQTRQEIARRDLDKLRQDIPRVAAVLEGLGWASDSPAANRERKLQTARLLKLLEQERRLISKSGQARYWENLPVSEAFSGRARSGKPHK